MTATETQEERLLRLYRALPGDDQRALVRVAMSLAGGDPRSWAPPGATFTCPRCGATSAHPLDVAEGYCGACHDWTGAQRSSQRLAEQPQSDRETRPARGGGAE